MFIKDEYLEIYGGTDFPHEISDFIDIDKMELHKSRLEKEIPANFPGFKGRHLSIHFVNSTSLTANAVVTTDNIQLIVIPIGIFARFGTIFKLLIRYFKVDSSFSIISTPLDNLPKEFYEIPKELCAIYYDTDSDLEFWEAITELKGNIAIENSKLEGFENHGKYSLEYDRFMKHILTSIVIHEFCHLLNYHHFILKYPEKFKDYGLSEKELLKGMEIQADAFSAKFSLAHLLEEWKVDFGYQPNSLKFEFCFFSYAFCTMFSVYDISQRFFRSFENDAYFHPMIRHWTFLKYSREMLIYCIKDEQEMKYWVGRFDHFEKLAHEKVTDAFQYLTFEYNANFLLTNLQYTNRLSGQVMQLEHDKAMHVLKRFNALNDYAYGIAEAHHNGH